MNLFSAHAEVFHTSDALNQVTSPLLRTRGGISSIHPHCGWRFGSSPHTRRYFHGLLALIVEVALFSAHAEVFPARHP
ncbi:hypothetical protein cgR_6042 [Corynebacterium glutamicum R]|uniref:Uncharacterized protein n=1 Tax=Corynebacterium glutamicum (strain R) TaxID=340322 RepID=A0AB72VFI7_CORGB|nr:hypothetical protein cgR_6042 [Corynebacterium glutamicum R]